MVGITSSRINITLSPPKYLEESLNFSQARFFFICTIEGDDTTYNENE